MLPKLPVVALLLAALLAPLATPTAAALHTCAASPPPCCDSHESCMEELQHPLNYICIGPICIYVGPDGICIYRQNPPGWICVVGVG